MPADLPAQIDGPVLVAVKAHHTAPPRPRWPAGWPGTGYVVSLQNGLNTTVLADAVGADRVVEAFVNFGADVIEPGVVLRGNRATFLIGEPDGRSATGSPPWPPTSPTPGPPTDVLGYIWAKQAYGAMLFATAVSDLPIYAVFDDPAYRDAAARDRPAEVLAQAPVPAAAAGRLRPGRPARLAGPAGRRSTGARRRRTRASTATWPSCTGPTEVRAILGPLPRRRWSAGSAS